jgi:hypothetical protein
MVGSVQGGLCLRPPWARAGAGVTGQAFLVSGAEPQPHEPSVAQLALAAAGRMRHPWNPATEPPVTRQATPSSSLRVASQARIADPLPAESSAGTSKGSVQQAAQAARAACWLHGREGAAA